MSELENEGLYEEIVEAYSERKIDFRELLRRITEIQMQISRRQYTIRDLVDRLFARLNELHSLGLERELLFEGRKKVWYHFFVDAVVIHDRFRERLFQLFEREVVDIAHFQYVYAFIKEHRQHGLRFDRDLPIVVRKALLVFRNRVIYVSFDGQGSEEMKK